tara:strand:+ start:2609 stop:2758 length:150 start_codon:yes stop_codon:yes gene_type:complete
VRETIAVIGNPDMLKPLEHPKMSMEFDMGRFPRKSGQGKGFQVVNQTGF